MKIILLIFLLITPAFAGQVEYGDTTITYDDQYSAKIFDAGEIIDIPDGTIVYASSFASEMPDTRPFRNDMTGVKFYNCNLDNVTVPNGNEIIGGQHKRYKSQSDGRDWLIDENNNPTELL